MSMFMAIDSLEVKCWDLFVGGRWTKVAFSSADSFISMVTILEDYRKVDTRYTIILLVYYLQMSPHNIPLAIFEN